MRPKAFCLVIVLLLCMLFSSTSSLAIYRDTDKSHRSGRQLNDLFYDDEYPVSPYQESRWESAEWPQHGEIRGRDDDSLDSQEHPYNWFYYNKYVNNGYFNHLYNGPKVDLYAGMGKSGNNPPSILPRPVPSFGRTSDMPKRFE